MTMDVSEDVFFGTSQGSVSARCCGCVQLDVSVWLESEFLEELGIRKSSGLAIFLEETSEAAE